MTNDIVWSRTFQRTKKFSKDIVLQNCICYNASRLKRYKSSTWTTNENPGAATPGFSIPFWYGGLDHRPVTDYLSPSNHLQTRWLITPATTAITRDTITSNMNTSFLSPVSEAVTSGLYHSIFDSTISFLTTAPDLHIILCQNMNIASPKLKNRYLSFTASSYAASTCSLPASADTSIKSVDSGR